MRRVMIATPSMDGKVDCYYADSLLRSTKELSLSVEILPLWELGDSLLVRARNNLFKLAYESGVDDLIFIDSDIGWEPWQLARILSHDEDFIGGTYLKKTLDGIYVVLLDPEKTVQLNGLVEVRGLGAGFLRLSQKAVKMLYEKAQEYHNGESVGRMVFECGPVDGELVSEDIQLCWKWQKLGGRVMLDTAVTLRHTGAISLQGDFARDMLKPIVDQVQKATPVEQARRGRPKKR